MIRPTKSVSLELRNALIKLLNVLGMSNELDGRKQIQRENTHDRLSIYRISALYKINVIISKYNAVDKLADILDIRECDHHFVHIAPPFIV
jgi:hypothetical protein